MREQQSGQPPCRTVQKLTRCGRHGGVMGERFFVVQTLPAAEATAAINLRAQKFTTFYPTRAVDEKTAKRLRRLFSANATGTVPIISGYIFTMFDRDQDRWRSINGTRGVKRILGDPERPTPVPIGAVEEMMSRWTAGEYEKRAEPIPFKYGDKLRITAGAFADRLASFDSAVGDELQVVLDLFGRELKIPLLRTAVEAV